MCWNFGWGVAVHQSRSLSLSQSVTVTIHGNVIASSRLVNAPLARKDQRAITTFTGSPSANRPHSCECTPADQQPCATTFTSAPHNPLLVQTIKIKQPSSQSCSGGGGGGSSSSSSSSSLPPPLTSHHFVLSSTLSPTATICPRLDLMCCSVRSLVMPHSATISASGDEISSTISWNSGVSKSQICINW